MNQTTVKLDKEVYALALKVRDDMRRVIPDMTFSELISRALQILVENEYLGNKLYTYAEMLEKARDIHLQGCILAAVDVLGWTWPAESPVQPELEP